MKENPKSEILNPKQNSKSQISNSKHLEFRISNFGFNTLRGGGGEFSSLSRFNLQTIEVEPR